MVSLTVKYPFFSSDDSPKVDLALRPRNKLPCGLNSTFGTVVPLASVEIFITKKL